MFHKKSIENIVVSILLSMLTACASTEKTKQNDVVQNVVQNYGSAHLYASIGMPRNVLEICSVGNTPDIGELVLNDLTISPDYENVNGYMKSDRQGVINLANALDRKAVFMAYDAYAKNLNDHKAYRKALVESYYKPLFNNKVKIAVSVEDQSGLYKNDVDFTSIVKVTYNDVRERNKFIISSCADCWSSDTVFKRSAINTDALIKAINELNNNIKIDNESLASLASYYKVVKNRIDSAYIYDLDVADTVPVSEINTPLPVKVIITSKKYDKSLFPNHTLSDKNISIELRSGFVKIHNKSDEYVTLLSITTYFNDIVSNYSLKDEQAIELPPHSYSKDIYYSSLITKNVIDAAKIEYIDLSLSKKTKVAFGFAAKYRMGAQNIDKTLYAKQNIFSVYDILKSNKFF